VDAISPLAIGCAFAALMCNWLFGEQQIVTKRALTFVYVCTWLLVFIGFWAVSAAQAIFAIVALIMTFGIDWMMNR
jgi:hypothetical protein